MGLRIEMLETNKPYRYIKIKDIEYGITYRIENQTIKSAKLLEEIDPISNALSINTLIFEILQKNPEFIDVGSYPNNYIMKNQPLWLFYNNNPFGIYFLDSWEDKTLNSILFGFNATDAIGVMDKYKYFGNIYNDVPIKDIISELFNICFPTNLVTYLIDDFLTDKTITGYIPICSCREALQYICFAIGAIADSSRREFVWIYPLDEENTFRIPQHEVYINGTLRTNKYVSQVSVTGFNYISGNREIELYNGILRVGQHIIQFAQPVHNIMVTGANVLDSGVNFAKIDVLIEQNILIKGLEYIENQFTDTIKDEYLEPGEIENVVIADKCTLINKDNISDISQKIFNYYKNRVQLHSDIKLLKNEVGYTGTIMIQNGKVVNGIIEQLDINLRGDKARAKITGNILGTKFVIEELPAKEQFVYIFKDDGIWDDNKNWIDGYHN
jgi:hypothetical protein